MSKFFSWHVWAAAAIAVAAVLMTIFDPSPLILIAIFLLCASTSSSKSESANLADRLPLGSNFTQIEDLASSAVTVRIEPVPDCANT